MVNSITIFKPQETSTFTVGAKLMAGKEKTEIEVEKISVFFGTAKIKLSNGENLIFNGFPIVYETRNKRFNSEDNPNP